MKKRVISNKELPKSAMEYVLEGLIPYTDANLKLSFKTSAFLDDLENIIHNKKKWRTLQNSYYKAIKDGLIELNDGYPTLTAKGRKRLKPFKPSTLDKNTVLMVIFDVPETERFKRDRLRSILKNMGFRQIQKSIWVTKSDCREYLAMEIKHGSLGGYVKVYEAKSLNV